MRHLPRVSLYFPQEMIAELEFEAKRLNRTVTWVVRKAWELGRPERIVLTQRSFEQVVERLRSPGEPTRELLDLMRSDRDP